MSESELKVIGRLHPRVLYIIRCGSAVYLTYLGKLKQFIGQRCRRGRLHIDADGVETAKSLETQRHHTDAGVHFHIVPALQAAQKLIIAHTAVQACNHLAIFLKQEVVSSHIAVHTSRYAANGRYRHIIIFGSERRVQIVAHWKIL